MGYEFAHHTPAQNRRCWGEHGLRKRTEIFKSFLRVLSALRGEVSWQAHQIGTPLKKPNEHENQVKVQYQISHTWWQNQKYDSIRNWI
jgi:hypothetical protein